MRPRRGGRGGNRRALPAVEGLETRVVLYSASGNAWPAPQLVTISFMPDGTNIGGRPSDMQARMNGMFGSPSAWQNTILKAAQTWASYSNVNFEVVADDGAGQGSGSYQQGDPNFGDIRIGGYNFGNSTLATAYMPPPANNFSIAGDIQFNTGQTFRNGTTYDLFTVAAHEIGHALGLYHSGITAAQEFSSYNGVKSAFNGDDIAGIQATYGGARRPDSYDAFGPNDTMAAADDISSLVNNPSLQGVMTGLDLTTIGDVDYYRFTAPAWGSNVVNLTVSSDKISLLAPSITIYNAFGNALASMTAPGQYGSRQTLTWNGIIPWQTYYIKVDGADTSVFGTGAYGLGLSLSGGPAGSIPGPYTQKVQGSPLQSGGGQALVVNSEALVNTTTAGAQATSMNRGAVAIDASGGYVTTWASAGQDGGGYGIYAQRYNSAGARLGGEFRVNTTTADDQTNSVVAMDAAGDFVIAWQSAKQDGGGLGVYARRFSAAGTPLGLEFRVNTTTTGDQSGPAASMDASGDFVIAWQSAKQDGGGQGVYAQRYSAEGMPQGGEFRVNALVAGDQTNPSVASDALGNFTVAWSGADGSGKGVFAQRFDAGGLPLGFEFLVNSFGVGDQTNPSVAMNARGEMAISWQSNNQDGNGWGVYAQRYGVSGARLGGEVLVNTIVSGNQQNPAAALDNAGDLLVTWSNSNSTTWTIYGQQYTATGAPMGGEFVVNSTKGYTVNTPSVALNDNGTAVSVWTGGSLADKDGVLMQQYSLSFQGDQGYPGHKGRVVAIRGLQADQRAARKAGDLARVAELQTEIVGLRAEDRAATEATARRPSHPASKPSLTGPGTKIHGAVHPKVLHRAVKHGVARRPH